MAVAVAVADVVVVVVVVVGQVEAAQSVQLLLALAQQARHLVGQTGETHRVATSVDDFAMLV